MRRELWWWSVAPRAGITWTSEKIKVNLGQAGPKAVAYLSKTTAYYSLRAETSAKTKAPWTDRTGNARSGLSTAYQVEASPSGGTYTIDVYHRVPYGIWLEVRFGGRYAIINRTVDAEGRAFFKAANTVMARMFGGS